MESNRTSFCASNGAPRKSESDPDEGNPSEFRGEGFWGRGGIRRVIKRHRRGYNRRGIIYETATRTAP